MTETLSLRGVLKGHDGWVTCIATSAELGPNKLLSGSRDKALIIWDLTKEDIGHYGQPRRSLVGHSHFIEDVVISSDGQFALSSSWDSTLRLWDLSSGSTTKLFAGHKKDVLSVAFSPDNRQIVSGSRDKTIKLWNTLGECKWTMEDHTEWVSCVRFSPNTANPVVVSTGWDGLVKVWNLSNCRLRSSLAGHKGYINSVAISPDGSLCASGGRDGTAMLWDLFEGKHLYSLDAGAVIHTLVFSPNRYWLCAGTDKGIVIWDLESKCVVAELNANAPEFHVNHIKATTMNPACLSLAWNDQGSTLFAGYTDSLIRVWEVSSHGN